MYLVEGDSAGRPNAQGSAMEVVREVRGRSRVGRRNMQLEEFGRPNGPEVNPRGQGPRGYGGAARRLPAFEARDADGVTPYKLR